MASYKDFDREIKGYVDVEYGIIKNTDIFTNLSISRNYAYTFNYTLTNATNSQTLNDTYSTDRILNNYATTCENFTLLDGSFALFNKYSNKNGFYSERTIDYYIDYITSLGYEARDFILEIGTKSDLINGEAYGVTIYSQNNNFVLSTHGNQIVAELYDCDGDLIETSNNTKFYNNQFSVIFENNINNCYIKIKQFEFEYTDRPAIITHIDLGVSHVYKDSELIEFTVLEEVDKLVEETPSNELDVKIGDYDQLYDPLNPEGITKFLTEKSKFIPYIGIVLEDGQVDYTKMGEFFFNSIDYQDKEVTITAYNLMNELKTTKLRQVMVPDKMVQRDKYIIYPYQVTDYLKDYLSRYYGFDYDINLNNENMLEIQYIEDDDLMSFLKNMSMLDGVFYVDRNSKIVIREIDKQIKNILSKNELISAIKYSDVNNYKNIYYSQMAWPSFPTDGGDTSDVSNTYYVTINEEVTYIPLKTSYNDATIMNDMISYDGADSVEIDQTYDGSEMGNGNECQSLLFLKITGTVGSLVTITISKTNVFLIAREKPSITETKYLGSIDATITINNPLIYHNYEVYGYKRNYDKFIDKIYTYKVSCNYNGDTTIKAGDYIEVESDYGYIPIFVTKHSLTFDGGLSGTIEGVE